MNADKIHDKDYVVDLVKRLLSPVDAGPSAGYEMMVDENTAHEAAMLILALYGHIENA